MASLQNPAALNRDGVEKIAGRLLRERRLGEVDRLTELYGGGNNRAFLVATSEAPAKYFLKAYFQSPQDNRNRLNAEFSLCAFAKKIGITAIQEPIAQDEEHQIGIYAFIEGKHCNAKDVAKTHIEQAAKLIKDLNTHKDTDEAKRLPLASDACLTLQNHWDLAERRLDSLKNWQPSDGRDGADSIRLDNEAAKFISKELIPTWDSKSPGLKKEIERLGRGFDQPLSEANRIISPSDFGFHNALLVEGGGKIKFLDFEYAGWDDPVKMICDFFCQPKVPVAHTFFNIFFEGIAPILADADACLAAYESLMPIHRFKWIGMMISDFLPGVRKRRSFSQGPFTAQHWRNERLAAARKALEELKMEH